MKTKEEILNNHCPFKNVTGNTEYFTQEVLDAMEEYADAKLDEAWRKIISNKPIRSAEYGDLYMVVSIARALPSSNSKNELGVGGVSGSIFTNKQEKSLCYSVRFIIDIVRIYDKKPSDEEIIKIISQDFPPSISDNSRILLTQSDMAHKNPNNHAKISL